MRSSNYYKRFFRPLLATVAAMLATNVQAAEGTLDLRPLFKAVVQERCGEEREYRPTGGITCAKIAGGGKRSKPVDILQQIGEKAKAKVQALSQQAHKEDGACARGVVTTVAGGTRLRRSTPEEFIATIRKAAAEDAFNLTLPAGTMVSIPGVTQVQYDYKGLANGPEIRTFRIAVRVEGDVYRVVSGG